MFVCNSDHIYEIRKVKSDEIDDLASLIDNSDLDLYFGTAGFCVGAYADDDELVAVLLVLDVTDTHAKWFKKQVPKYKNEPIYYWTYVFVKPEHRGNNLQMVLEQTAEDYIGSNAYFIVCADTDNKISTNNILKCGFTFIGFNISTSQTFVKKL